MAASKTPAVEPTSPPVVATIHRGSDDWMVQEHGEVVILEDQYEPNNPFEGPEKLLELWFASSAESVPDTPTASVGKKGLRSVSREAWQVMLDEVRCKVLSVVEGDELDAYLLSESSMFVWPHKLILKTCGTTTLLLGLPSLLRIAAEDAGFTDNVWRCFYSRKTFMFPERQIGPHRKWEQELSYLDNVFGQGAAYTVGKMNGDHWLLYLTTPRDEIPAAPAAVAAEEQLVSIPQSGHSKAVRRAEQRPSPPDQTLEMLMSHLDPEACKSFFHPHPDEATSSRDGHDVGSTLSARLGMDKLFPRATLDSFVFAPCGYSANFVQGDRYATAHVTPEEAYSYASFETNANFHESDTRGLSDLVERVLAIFRPGSLSITLFVSTDDETGSGSAIPGRSQLQEMLDPLLLKGWIRQDRILYEFAGYHLLYLAFGRQQSPAVLR